MPIAHPSLYDAVYSALRDRLGAITTTRVVGDLRVFRLGAATDAGRAGADMYRTVYQSSTNDAYRWTGPRPPHISSIKPAAGGIYTALGFNDALLGEFAFYAFHTTLDHDVQRMVAGKSTRLDPATFGPALATKRIFEYAVAPALQIADFSLTSRGGLELVRALDGVPAVRTALQAAGFHTARHAYLASKDHSLPRAMAQVVRDHLPGCKAIRVSSARAQAAVRLQDAEGDNLVFFGADGALLGDLTPRRETWFQKAPNGTFKDVSAPL